MKITTMDTTEVGRIRILPGSDAGAGFGALRTDRGNLPLDRLAVRARVTGLVAETVVVTEFVNTHDTALEATYVFPLPDRAAVTGMTMTADGRTVEAELQERAAAREAYDRAVDAGQRASIAEEERPDVFTMRVGNLVAGERVTVELRLIGPLPYEDGAATFRFPLVVAPRYVPGQPLPGTPVGSGTTVDTDAVPDASRITPPVLLPGFPNPLRLSVDVDIDPAGLELTEVRSSLHAVVTEGRHVSLRPGEKADRDVILRLAYAPGAQSAVAVPDPDDDAEQAEHGTYRITVLPPTSDTARRPRDVVLLLDRSGSMGGWKMIAARRAAARVVDTLTGDDRFAVLAFDHQVQRPEGLGEGLSEATDRHRFRAVEHLSTMDARGGTELLAPLREGLRLLAGEEARDRVLVLVTDGQVGNEDQILGEVAPLVGGIRVHTIGIDRAVNAGFLGRLAAAGAGRTELVESEDRLDEAMEHIHRRIGAPVVTDLVVTADGLDPVDATRSPYRMPGLFPGVPLVLTGRYAGTPSGTVTVTGRTRDDQEFRTTIPVQRRDDTAVAAQWARARLRDLEDRYATGEHQLEHTIVATSLRFGVLCRFTAYVAIDSRVVNSDGETRRVTQPVELPSGWEMPVAAAAPMMTLAASAGAMPPPAAAPRTGFAPTQASARTPGGRARSFGMARQKMASVPAPGGRSQTSVDDLRSVARIEADRLRDAAGQPAYERRMLLEDLVARLTVLLEGQTGDAIAPLRELLSRLGAPSDRAESDLDARWADAARMLAEFGGGSGDSGDSGGGRKAFWKR